MGDHGHEATEGGYSAWAATTTTAPPEEVRRHLVDPDRLCGWVPGAETVTVDGEAMRMEILVDPRSGSRATFVTELRGGDDLHVTRTWGVEASRTRLTERVEDDVVQTLAVTYALTPTGTGTAVTVRLDTRAPGISARIARVSGRAQATGLDQALDRLVLAAEGRRRGLRRLLSTPAPVGPL